MVRLAARERPPRNGSVGWPCENGRGHGRAPCSAHGGRSWNDGEIAARRLRSGPVRGIILATGLALAPGLVGCSPVTNKSEAEASRDRAKIGRASCRARVCQYV